MPATHDYAGVAAWNFKMLHEVRSYEQAREVFESLYLSTTGDARAYNGGTRLEYKIGPNMWLRDGDGYYAVVLYDTEIIRYYPDGTFSVDNGGHNTLTTTERLNAVLPEGFRAYHRKKLLGLSGKGYSETGAEILWPLDHSRRIMTTTAANR